MKSLRISREELHNLVWKTPMSRLAREFGITGNGLAKICDRLAVPYPSRGYWAKKEAGKPVITFRLLDRADDVPEFVDIHPSAPKPKHVHEVRTAIEAASIAVEKVTVPETLHHLHSKVKAWLVKHKQDQKERRQENRQWNWTRPLIGNLTDRDRYRFRVTSAIFKLLEQAGGKIEDAPITGKVTFLISGHKVECSITEKMQRAPKPLKPDLAKWTAYPDHHQSGLESTGFLRVKITTYLLGRQLEWIETSKKKISAWLPEIVGSIMSAGPILSQRQREQDESARRYQQEQACWYEQKRLKDIDDKHWTEFRSRAADWEERARLLAFVAELQRRLEVEGDTQVGDRPLSEWIAWSQEKIDAHDPLSQGLHWLFESISR